jgi:hypothetical protein
LERSLSEAYDELGEVCLQRDGFSARAPGAGQAAASARGRAPGTGVTGPKGPLSEHASGRRRIGDAAAEIVGLTNERDFPYLVELTLPPGRFGRIFLEIDAFHRERRIPVRRGRSRHEVKPFYIRFCFPDAATADAFRNRFGGECLTHTPAEPKPRTSATSSDAPA